MSILNLCTQDSLDHELTTLDIINSKLINLNDDANNESNSNLVGENVDMETTLNNINESTVQEEIAASTSVNVMVPLDTSSLLSLSSTKPIICTVCGRKLKDPQSRIIGMGPMCAKHYKNRKKRFNLFDNERILL